MTPARRKQLTSQLLNSKSNDTTAASINKSFDDIVTNITNDAVNLQESNNIASQIHTLTYEYQQITTYAHTYGISNIGNVTYLSPDPTIGTTHAALPLTQDDVQEMWDGASLKAGNVFYVPTPNMYGGAQSQMMVLDPTSQADIDSNQNGISTMDPIVPAQYMALGDDTVDLITGYTEKDTILASVWALNTYLYGQSGSNKSVYNTAVNFTANGTSNIYINIVPAHAKTYDLGSTLCLNYGSNYCVAVTTGIITKDVVEMVNKGGANGGGQTAVVYQQDAGNIARILFTSSQDGSAFPNGTGIYQSLGAGSGITQEACSSAINYLLTVLNNEKSILTGCLVKSKHITASINNINITISAINTWLINPWDSGYINTLLASLNSRLNTVIPARATEIRADLPGMYKDRAAVVQLRLTKNQGTLNNVHRSILRAKKNASQSTSSGASDDYYSSKFVLQAVVNDADNSKNICVKAISGSTGSLSSGDDIFIIADDQNEIETYIVGIQQTTQQVNDTTRSTVQSQTETVYNIVLADRIPDYYTVSNNLRIAKQLSE